MIISRIRAVVAEHANLPLAVDTLANEADLYAAGLTSFATVQLMLGLEGEFDVEIPETLLNRRTFQSIDAMATIIGGLLGGPVV